MYAFHEIQVQVTCRSSIACGNASSTMQQIQERPDVLAAPVRQALGQPTMAVLGVAIDQHVRGDVAPGLAPLQSPRSAPGAASQPVGGGAGAGAGGGSGGGGGGVAPLLAGAALAAVAGGLAARYCLAGGAAPCDVHAGEDAENVPLFGGAASDDSA